MSDDPAIQIEGVDKVYKLYPSLRKRLADTLGHSRNREDIPDFAALKGINLEIEKGERVGLIGRNGAGKTTLLKLLIGHIKPTKGTINVHGSVQAMIHTNLGVHLHFTGRENIISSLTYNNLKPSEIVEAMEDIEEFTELGSYLDQPIKNYSLGMRSRLQFAISSAIKPDILIVDEMLGAGDTYFIRKSNRRMQNLIDSGCTLVLVSHNTQQVLQFCEKAIWLRSGQVYYESTAREVVNAYDVYIERETQKRHSGVELSEKTDRRILQSDVPEEEFLTELADGKKVYRWPSPLGVKVQSLDFYLNDEVSSDFKTGDVIDLKLKLDVEVTQNFACRYLVTIWDKKGLRVARVENDVDEFKGKKGDVRDVKITLDPFMIGAGEYTISCAIYDMKNYRSTSKGANVRLDVVAHALDFFVKEDDKSVAPVYLHAKSKIIRTGKSINERENDGT